MQYSPDGISSSSGKWQLAGRVIEGLIQRDINLVVQQSLFVHALELCLLRWPLRPIVSIEAIAGARGRSWWGEVGVVVLAVFLRAFAVQVWLTAEHV